jgi:ribose transport system ATP-binding protein/inositol transport system ATP-binding protein
MGLDRVDSGSLTIGGKDVGMLSNTETEKYGLVMVPENRKLQGLILKNTVSFNTSLAVLRKFIHYGFVDKKKENEIVMEQVQNLSIRTPSTKQNVGNLSGGNQQKVLFGKWLATEPKVLMLDEPTRGVDVGAKADIYAIIDALAAQGIAVIMVSSELPEIINMCDRVLVMAGGRITGELQRAEFSQEKIMQYATNLEGERVS